MIRLEQTMDPHSRKVFWYTEEIGTLLFHDWVFKLDTFVPSTDSVSSQFLAHPIRLDICAALLDFANRDESIRAQKLADHQKRMAATARKELRNRPVDPIDDHVFCMPDRVAVETYLGTEYALDWWTAKAGETHIETEKQFALRIAERIRQQVPRPTSAAVLETP